MNPPLAQRNRLEPVKRRTAEQVAVETTRRAILLGELPGGTRLIQQEVAAELRISTTPVREAFRVLAAEGLIEFDPHRGAVVREVNADEMREIMWLRCQLEPECMRRAADRRDQSSLALAERLAAQMEQESDVATWTTLNREFHAALCEASGSRWFASLLASLRSAAAIYLGASLRAAARPMVTGNAEHRQLLTAIQQGDREEAARIALLHATTTHSMVDEPRESQHHTVASNEKGRQ